MNRGVIAVIFVVVALAALVWSQWDRAPFFVSGFIEADDIRVGSRVGGRVEAVPAVEGKRVAPGEPLVQLEAFDLHEQLAQAEAQLAARQAELARLRAGLRPEEIAQARARLERSQAVLDRLVAGPRALEIQILESRLQVAEAELEKAQSDFDRIQALYEEQRASQEEFEDAQRNLRAASGAHAQARDELKLAREGTRQEEIAEARAAVGEARAALELAEAGFRVEEITAAQAAVDAASAEAAAIRTRLDELRIVSPCDCVVEAVDLEPGDLVAANAPVLSLLDLDHLWVRAYVPENRLDIAVGQEVSIGVDAFPGRRFAGRVSFVARQAEFTPQNVQTPEERVKQMFRIKVDLAESDDVLRPGMAADVFFDRREGVASTRAAAGGGEVAAD